MASHNRRRTGEVRKSIVRSRLLDMYNNNNNNKYLSGLRFLRAHAFMVLYIALKPERGLLAVR